MKAGWDGAERCGARGGDARVAAIERGRRRVVDREASAAWAPWLCAAAALLAIGAFWLVRLALIDDAYITLSYARNLATSLHWGLIPTEPANSATSPLNVVLLGAATALLRPLAGVQPVWGLGIVFGGSAVAMAWWWSRVATASGCRRWRRRSGWGWCS
jgi:hypothetical protein